MCVAGLAIFVYISTQSFTVPAFAKDGILNPLYNEIDVLTIKMTIEILWVSLLIGGSYLLVHTDYKVLLRVKR